MKHLLNLLAAIALLVWGNGTYFSHSALGDARKCLKAKGVG